MEVEDATVGSEVIRELVLIANKITMTIEKWESGALVSIFYGISVSFDIWQAKESSRDG